MAENRQWYLF